MKKSKFIDYAVLMAVRSQKKKNPSIDSMISAALTGGSKPLHIRKRKYLQSEA